MKRRKTIRSKKNIYNNKLLIKGVRTVETMLDNTHSDDNYLNEALVELGIDLNRPKKSSKLPRNKNGLHVIPKGSAGKDMLTMYREEKGRC